MSPDPDDGFRDDLIAIIPQMRAFARSLCGDPTLSDDLVQDTLAKAWKHHRQFARGTNLKAWLYRILRNQFYSGQRRAWRQAPLDAEATERTLLAADDPSICLEVDELRRALAQLPEDQREALILVGAGGLSYEEAADLTEVAVGTVKSRVHRARQALAGHLERGRLPADGTAAHRAFDEILASLRTLQLAA